MFANRTALIGFVAVTLLSLIGVFLVGNSDTLIDRLNLNASSSPADSPSRPNTPRPSYYTLKKQQYEGLPDAENEIIFLGDSLTDQGEWAEILDSPHGKIINRGIAGDTTTGILKRLDEVVSSQPAKIFLLVGINDLLGEREVSEILASYQEILQTIQEKSPQTQLFIQSVLPVNYKDFAVDISNEDINTLNQGLQQLADRFSASYIDLHSVLANHENQLDSQYTLDGVHLTGEAYLRWQEVVKPYL
ncbi:MAG: GDSL-type esterase/lipase family protein [Cyanophyceae cyanobacterium]